MDFDINVTILTPTYNRAYALPKLYDSLCKQTDKRFIWIIVDDGSSDNTKEVVLSFKCDFEIEYIYKQNGGKHTAVNVGVQRIQTEYTFIVDSDDYLKNNAIEYINKWIKETAGITGLAGVSGLASVKNEIIGQFPDDCEYIECLNSERKQYNLQGDKSEVYKTELLKYHPFPVYEDERFMPESIVWNQFSLEGLKIRWYKECIKVCEYLDDGLTSATKNIDHFRKNFKGYRDDCALSLKVHRFPYNYSAASVFYARCYAIGEAEHCLDNLGTTLIDRSIIILLGKIRYKTGRY